jgi:hypothetical protein
MEAVERRIEALVERLIDHVRQHEPVEATRLGLTERDGDLPDLSLESLEAQTRSLTDLEAAILLEVGALPGANGDGADGALGRVPGRVQGRVPGRVEGRSGAVREAAADLELLRDAVRWRRIELEDRPALALDPGVALGLAVGGVLDLLRDDHGTEDPDERRRRIGAAMRRARQVPAMLEQAGRLLTGVSAPSFELLEDRLPSAIALMRDLLPARAQAVGLEVDAARDAGEYAAEGIEAFGALVDELVDDRRLDWRVGPTHIDRALRRSVGTTMDAQSIEDRARTTLQETRAEMVEIASAGWERRFPGLARPDSDDQLLRAVLDHVGDSAVTAERLIPETRRALDETRDFLAGWGEIDLPPEQDLQLVPMGETERGVAVAFLRRPPPLGPHRPSAFHLSPVPATWNGTRARSFLREYHPATLRSLAVHEAYPGHFVQLAHSAQHPRTVRRLFGRAVFAEGWAVLMEEVVIEAGFGEDGTSSVSREDLILTQRKMKLRSAANALLDLGLHAASMTDDDAMALLTGAALQEQAEAQGKLRRAKLTCGQLSSYYAGFAELKALQRRERARAGASFDLGAFLRRTLSHGTPTVAIVADALADDAPTHRPFAPAAA